MRRHDPNHVASSPAAPLSSRESLLTERTGGAERRSGPGLATCQADPWRSPGASLLVRAMQAAGVSQRQLASAIGRWPSEVARWCLYGSMPTTVLVEIAAELPKLFRAYVDLASELPADAVPVGEDPTGAALDACDKAGHLAGLVRARTRGVEVERASQDAITAVRRVRAACRGAA